MTPFEIVLTFGNYIGHTLGSVAETDPNYLLWMSEKMSGDWKIAAAKTLANEPIPDTLNLPKISNAQVTNIKESNKKKPIFRLIKKGKVSVTFPYNPQLLSLFKSQIESRKWNDKEKYWEINIVHLPAAIKLFGGPTNVDCTDDIKESVINEMEKRKTLDKIRVKEDSDFFDNSLLKHPLYGYQNSGVEFICYADERALIADSPGLGKAQTMDSRIITPNGPVLMKDVFVGQEISSTTGEKSFITGIFPQGNRSIYEIKFHDGSTTRCSDDHLWLIRNHSRTKGKFHIRSTLEIIERKNCVPYQIIPVTDPVEFVKRNLLIHPYVMGVLLGDGCICRGNITISSTDMEIIENMRSLVPNCLLNKVSKCDFRFKSNPKIISNGKKGIYNSPLRSELSSYGLLGMKSNNKFIPDEYLYSDIEDRISLLQGLMDTDGYVAKLIRGSATIQYYTVSEKLMENMKFLIQSLGGVCKVTTKIPKYTYKSEIRVGQKCYVMTISMHKDIVPFKLQRKRDRYLKRTFKYLPYRKIIDISYVGEMECQCISVSAADHLYLTDEFIVTHNTVQAIAFAVMKKYKTLIICPNSVKINWSREIDFFTGKKCCIWYADRKEGHGNAMFHIINYDIVHKFSKELRDVGFDLMVCDECTEIKNKKAKRTKSILGDYSQRRKYPGIKTKAVLLLTGTPVMNRPSEIFTFLNFLNKEKWPNYFAFAQKYGGWMGSPPKNLNLLHESIKDVVIRRRKDQIKSDLPEKLPPRNMYVELSDSDQKEYVNLLKKLFRNWKESKPGIGTMPPINKFLIEKKLPRIIEMIDSFLEEDRSVTIYCTMLNPLFKLKEKYGEIAGLLYGDMTPEERQVTIDGIANKKLKIALISLRAGRMGIDGLQYGCDTAIFCDQWWGPSDHVQAEDRLHRNGQLNKVQIFYMLCADTIDEDMRELLAAKQVVIDTVVDGSIVTQSRKDSIFSQFVQRMKFKYQSEF